MLSRFLEKKVEIEVRETPGKPGNMLELEYYLVESEPENENHVTGDWNYGIEIIKKQGGAKIESMFYRDMFPGREETRKLVGLLAKNTVTPVSLPYIMDDML